MDNAAWDREGRDMHHEGKPKAQAGTQDKIVLAANSRCFHLSKLEAGPDKSH